MSSRRNRAFASHRDRDIPLGDPLAIRCRVGVFIVWWYYGNRDHLAHAHTHTRTHSLRRGKAARSVQTQTFSYAIPARNVDRWPSGMTVPWRHGPFHSAIRCDGRHAELFPPPKHGLEAAVGGDGCVVIELSVVQSCVIGSIGSIILSTTEI